MEIQGTIERILPVESGMSRSTNKEWRKGGFILTTGGQYPKKIHVTLFGKTLDEVQIQVGQYVTAQVDVSSRDWTNPNTGKVSWFTEVSAYRVTPADAAAPQPQPAPVSQPQPQPQQLSAYEQTNAIYGASSGGFPGAAVNTTPQGDDDLPF